mmetsp:Transcript_616/g.1554  ORF Transcript_616/g.1554 Transcript_616/m.1554 type:complete len:211 (+) Transcript_616:2538-3170(+)
MFRAFVTSRSTLQPSDGLSNSCRLESAPLRPNSKCHSEYLSGMAPCLPLTPAGSPAQSSSRCTGCRVALDRPSPLPLLSASPVIPANMCSTPTRQTVSSALLEAPATETGSCLPPSAHLRWRADRITAWWRAILVMCWCAPAIRHLTSASSARFPRTACRPLGGAQTPHCPCKLSRMPLMLWACALTARLAPSALEGLGSCRFLVSGGRR